MPLWLLKELSESNLSFLLPLTSEKGLAVENKALIASGCPHFVFTALSS